jgi:hypothetical protein
MPWPPKTGESGTSKSVLPPPKITGGHAPPVGPDIRDLISKPTIFVPPGPITGGHIPVPLPDPPKGHIPGPEIKLPNITDIPHPDIHLPDIGRPDIPLPDWLQNLGGQQTPPTDQGTPESYSDMLERLRQLGSGADSNSPSVPADPSQPSMSSEQILALLMELIARMQSPRSDMGAGLSMTMRPPIRMPSGRMEMSHRAGWVPRTGGIARRSPMGTSAMLKV